MFLIPEQKLSSFYLLLLLISSFQDVLIDSFCYIFRNLKENTNQLTKYSFDSISLIFPYIQVQLRNTNEYWYSLLLTFNFC